VRRFKDPTAQTVGECSPGTSGEKRADARRKKETEDDIDEGWRNGDRAEAEKRIPIENAVVLHKNQKNTDCTCDERGREADRMAERRPERKQRGGERAERGLRSVMATREAK